MHSVRTQRLFFALWPSDALREQIARTVKPALEGRRARPVKAANLHITLAFLGSVIDGKLPDVIEAGNQVKGDPFELPIDYVESWRAAHVACISVAPIPTQLTDLVACLRSNLLAKELEVDQKEFRAHLTIARDWRDKRLDERIGPLAWRVDDFVLVDSRPGPQGSEYQIVQRWPLRAQDCE